MSEPTKPNIAVLVGGLVLTGALVAVLASGFGRDPKALPSVLEQKPAPEFIKSDLDGNEWRLSALKGRWVVINFWSTWCLPCKSEHPLLLSAASEYPDVQFLGVVFSDEIPKVDAYLRKNGSAYPHLADPDGRMAIDYGVGGVPETFFIGPDGTIVKKIVGPLDEATLNQLLEGAKE